jgi:membrane protein DedA with SNARE-associated domain
LSLLSEHGLLHLISVYGPGLVGVVTALEAMGLPLPAESLLIGTAAALGTGHHPGIVWLLAATAAGAIIGDNLGYLIGRSLGWRALRRWGRHIGLSEDRLTLGTYLFRRHGGKVVFFGRFIVILRTASALLAGANRMDWWWFLPCNAAGGIVWAVGYGLGAYWLGNAVKHVAGPVGIAMGVVGACALLGTFLVVRKNEQILVERAKQETRGPAGVGTQPG